ncbi:MAG: DUF4012 domain-containing protein, partial [Actinomycetota bacterium]|nr:DUF4012 domain-containing protein [Actinomycetota bacterium]
MADDAVVQRRRLAFVLATVLLGGFALVTISGVAGARRDLVLAQSDLDVAREELVARHDEAARAALQRAGRRLASARDRADTAPMRLLASVPVLGSPSRAIADVARAGLEAAAAGRVVLDATTALPTAASTTLDGADLRPFHAAALRSAGALTHAISHLDGARRSLDAPAGAVLPPVAGAARRMQQDVDRARRQLDSARRGLDTLADLSSPEADVRILVLAQDSLELRPTGGYIGSYGVVRFSHAAAVLERYEATEDLPVPQPPAEPPPDLAPFLPGPWQLSNVNWWPDFPTTARAAAEMFRRQGGGDVAGVLALTEHAMARILGAVGPVYVPGYAEPVSDEGFSERVVYEVELKKPQDVPRKRFLIELARVLFDRIFHVPRDRLPALTRALGRSTGNGDLQLWFHDPIRQRRLDGTAVSGVLPRGTGDFLLLADANMAATKANLGLVKDATYRVDRARDGT